MCESIGLPMFGSWVYWEYKQAEYMLRRGINKLRDKEQEAANMLYTFVALLFTQDEFPHKRTCANARRNRGSKVPSKSFVIPTNNTHEAARNPFLLLHLQQHDDGAPPWPTAKPISLQPHFLCATKTKTKHEKYPAEEMVVNQARQRSS